MRLFLIGQKWLAAEVARRVLALGCELLGARAPEAEDRFGLFCRARGIPLSLKPDCEAVEPGEIPEGVDLILCAQAFAYVTPEAIARARLGAVGYHPSLLPEFPGRRAVEAAVAAGRKTTGGTVYRLDASYDTGPILLQRSCAILPGESPAELWRRALAPMGADMLEEMLRGMMEKRRGRPLAD